jgi:predicted ATPase
VYPPVDFLKRCEYEGLIVDCGQEWFKWEHDKIQEAALSLIPNELLPSVQFEVGELLLARLPSEEVDENLFVITNLLNQEVANRKYGLIKRIDIAKLNLRAGRTAIESSAFQAAATYFEKGIEMLPETAWVCEYELSLALHSAAAKAQYCVGNFEAMKLHCDAVLSQTNRPFIDKRQAYNTLLQSLSAQGYFQEAQDLCVKVLAILGCRFPKYGRSAWTIAGVLRTELSLKKSTEKIPNLPPITDESKKWTMSLLDNLTTYACKCFHSVFHS